MSDLFSSHPIALSLLMWGAAVLVGILIVEIEDKIRRSSHD